MVNRRFGAARGLVNQGETLSVFSRMLQTEFDALNLWVLWCKILFGEAKSY